MTYRQSAKPMRPGRRTVRCWPCRGTGTCFEGDWYGSGYEPGATRCWACDGRATYEAPAGLIDRIVAALGRLAAWAGLPALIAWAWWSERRKRRGA